MVIKVSTMFATTPGGRYIKDGVCSGELFRTGLLERMYSICLLNDEKLYVDLDDIKSYKKEFLEEAFGGLVRRGFSYEDLLTRIVIVSLNNPKLIDDINNYILDAAEKEKEKKGRRL